MRGHCPEICRKHDEKFCPKKRHFSPSIDNILLESERLLRSEPCLIHPRLSWNLSLTFTFVFINQKCKRGCSFSRWLPQIISLSCSTSRSSTCISLSFKWNSQPKGLVKRYRQLLRRKPLIFQYSSHTNDVHANALAGLSADGQD